MEKKMVNMEQRGGIYVFLGAQSIQQTAGSTLLKAFCSG